MSIFRKIVNEKYLFSEKGKNSFKLVLAIESAKNDEYILSYIDGKSKKKIKLNKENLQKYDFIKRTNNHFYKKYVKITESEILNEMVTADVGVGGTAPDQFSGDFYAQGDARNIFGTNKQLPVIKRPKIKDTFLKTKKNAKKRKTKDNT